jgi:hypothetical protein
MAAARQAIARINELHFIFPVECLGGSIQRGARTKLQILKKRKRTPGIL